MLTDQLVQWRRHLHAHPELSFREVETSTFIHDVLSEIPYMEVEVGIGLPTAVVGTLTNGAGPVIAIRADMDALPIQEENAVDYRSQHEGVMHACGHDAHTAIALGVATSLGESLLQSDWQGTVKFLFQPAEEMADKHGSTGAPYMIKAGALDHVDAVLSLHMSPEDQVGEVKIHDGYSMAAVDVFTASIFGTGGHGAYPHLGTDPIWMLAPVLQAVYGITGRTVSPLDPAVVSIGKIATGSASNIIPSQVEIMGTIRSYDPSVRVRIHAELQKAFSMVDALGGTATVDIVAEDPALKNDPAINQLITEVIAEIYPAITILNTPFGLGGEDFSHMTNSVPGAMFFLGCGQSTGDVRNLHTPTFDLDERSLPIGVSILTEAVKRFLIEQA